MVTLVPVISYFAFAPPPRSTAPPGAVSAVPLSCQAAFWPLPNPTVLASNRALGGRAHALFADERADALVDEGQRAYRLRRSNRRPRATPASPAVALDPHGVTEPRHTDQVSLPKHLSGRGQGSAETKKLGTPQSRRSDEHRRTRFGHLPEGDESSCRGN